MNNAVNKLILDRESCEKLQKKLRFADPVFITSGIYIYVKFILRWIMWCQFIFKRWFIHLRCFIHLRLMTRVEWHRTSVLMNYKAKFVFNWSICQHILQMCKQINQERHIFNFTLDLNYDVIGLKQLKDLSHLASCSQMDNLSVVEIQPLCTGFIMQWNLY